jgi:hypothetical protein
MFNPDMLPASLHVPSFEAAARSLKVETIIARVHSDVEIETFIINLGREPGGGLVVLPNAFMSVHREPTISAAGLKQRTGGLCDILLCQRRWFADTLVIDTIGQKVGPLSMFDMYGAPFSAALRVIERYRLIDGTQAHELQ